MTEGEFPRGLKCAMTVGRSAAPEGSLWEVFHRRYDSAGLDMVRTEWKG
jgi:hypothetical protein